MKARLLWFLSSILPALLIGQNLLQLEGNHITATDFKISSNQSRILVGTVDLTREHDFDPSSSVMSIPGDQGTAAFIATYDHSGSFKSIISITDADIRPEVVNYAVEIDTDDNIYTLGTLRGKADFDPGQEVLELSATRDFESIGYICSYDPAGKPRFVLPLPLTTIFFGLSSPFLPNGSNSIFRVDPSGNIYLLIQGGMNFDFDPSVNEFIPNNGLFVISYDRNGVFRFGFEVPGNTTAIGTNDQGNIFVTGTLLGSLDDDFDYDPGEEIVTLDDPENTAFFVASYSTDAALNYVINATGTRIFPSIIDGDINGDVVISGRMDGSIDFAPGEATQEISISQFENDPSDLFIARYSSTGTLLMAQAMEDKIGQVSFEIVNDMEIDRAGNVYLTGTLTAGIVDLDPSENDLELMGGQSLNGNSSNGDLFVAVYNRTGAIQFAYTIPNSNLNYPKIEVEQGCSVYSSMGNLVLDENQDLDPGSGTLESQSTGAFLVTLTNDALTNNQSTECKLSVSTASEKPFETIQVFPNPTIDELNFKLSTKSHSKYLTIRNYLGQVICRKTIRSSDFSIDCSLYSTGLYFINFYDQKERKIANRRFLKLDGL